MQTQYIILITMAMIALGGFAVFAFSDPDRSSLEAKYEEDGHDGAPAPHEINPSAVVKKIENNEDLILLDVRMPEEYEKIHLKGAVLLPVQELSAVTLNEIGLGENAKDKEIIIYCRSGARSKTAYDIMESLGYTNIKSVSGGMIHWQEDEYPFTESGAYTGPIMMGETEEIMDTSVSPRIKLDRNSHDLGVVPQYGGVVETDFTITNIGKETLTIGELSTSCSCTAARVDDISVLPGQSTKLTVIFDPDFHEEPQGVFKRTVFIPTNDPKQPEAEVSIQVDIAEGQ